ncbi:MAG: leucine-rich repeat protein [Lachnospiraceae bacterium]|nr:leucine-rich repeat protein [Lachnospiraceae bacterium]
MEISSTGSTSGFKAVTEIDSDGSKSYPVGTYYVRYAGDENYNASEAVTVTIGAGRKLDVKFVNGTETIETVSVDYNASVSAPSTVPVKDGFIFDGWAEDELGATAFDFTNTKITADTTIYAKWIEKQADEPEPEQIVTTGPVIYYSPTPTPEAEKAAPTPDPDRVKNEDGTYSKTTVEKSSDGTVKTREVVTDENGKVLKTITTTESTDKEGTKKLNTITVTADGSRSEVTVKTYTSGKEIEVISQKNADGSEFYAKETKEADGSSVMNSIRSSATGVVTVNFASTTAEGKSTELTYEGVLPGSAADANSTDNNTEGSGNASDKTDSDKTENEYSNTKPNGKLTLTLTKGSTDEKNVTISSVLKINGKKYKVTNIASKAFAGNTTIEEITIGKYITSIEKGAFKNAKNLKDITFKSGKIKEIGKNAFKGIDKNAVITIFAGKKAYANLIELIKGAGIPKAAEFVEVK